MNRSKKILITGASGLIGSRLTELLLERGDSVSHLVRSKRKSTIPSFVWDIEKQFIDPEALHNVDTVIHLAGAGVAEKRWTDSRKKEILESRTKSTRLLFDTLKTRRHSVRNFIAASGIGYYGDQSGLLRESAKPGTDFLANVTRLWEEEADRISTLPVRVVKLRTGIALSQKGGALKELSGPVKYFAGAPLGSGDQSMSWIHIDDLCCIYLKAIDDERMRGAYNAVAPHPVTNREMTKTIGRILNRPVVLPPVPGFILKLMLGEMSDMVLKGINVSPKKIQEAGYNFKFTSLEDALRDLLKPE